MNKIAFLTMDSLAGFVSYDELVRDILSSRAIHVDEISWRANNVEWNQYELVVIRSPWDYQSAWDQFMGVLSQIDASNARLENCLSVARWNVEKTYLRDLREQGISIVPTTWMMSPSVADLHELFDRFNSDDVVIKPIVGANADDAFWLRRETSAETFQIASETFQGRMALGQPFVRSVTGYGEISLIFFAGQYSHSVLKKPKAGDFRVQEEHGGRIQSVVPEASIIEFAHRTLQTVPGETLYARVDLVFLDDGQPAVMEVELIEPSLYLSYDRQSPVRFADAIEALLGR
jgi:hypothetical protein